MGMFDDMMDSGMIGAGDTPYSRLTDAEKAELPEVPSLREVQAKLAARHFTIHGTRTGRLYSDQPNATEL